MMQQDSLTGRDRTRALSGETAAVLRDALSLRLRDAGATGPVRDALRAAAREARQLGMHAEELIILLKRLWVALPEVQQARDRHEQNLVLERLVSICIAEFYAEV